MLDFANIGNFVFLKHILSSKYHIFKLILGTISFQKLELLLKILVDFVFNKVVSNRFLKPIFPEGRHRRFSCVFQQFLKSTDSNMHS